MKKVLSIILALMIMILSLSCVAIAAVTLPGDVNGDGFVKATDARMVLQVVAGIENKSFLKNADNADVVADGQIKATDARMILQIVAGTDGNTNVTPPSPPSPPSSSDSQNAEYAELFNAETAKAVNGTYNWERSSRFVKQLKSDNVSVSSIQSIVDKAFGVGTTNGSKSNAGKNALVAMSLTGDDIKSVVQTTEQITLQLNDSVNPSKGGTPFNHVSNDFVTQKELSDAFSSKSITVKNLHVTHHNIQVTARLGSNGNPTELTITYKTYIDMDLKASGSSRVEGELETKIKYTNFSY